MQTHWSSREELHPPASAELCPWSIPEGHGLCVTSCSGECPSKDARGGTDSWSGSRSHISQQVIWLQKGCSGWGAGVTMLDGEIEGKIHPIKPEPHRQQGPSHEVSQSPAYCAHTQTHMHAPSLLFLWPLSQNGLLGLTKSKTQQQTYKRHINSNSFVVHKEDSAKVKYLPTQ